MSNYFEELNSINVNEHTDKKGQFTYLSWAYAWGEVKKLHPDSSYKIHKFGEDRKPYLFDEDLGYMVFTEVTLNEITHEMWLPVMNFRNQAMKKGEATMMDINKAIMRCLVKNIGMHGLGLYIYAGEDLPEETSEQIDNKKTQTAITNLFEAMVTEHGSNEEVYKNIKLPREEFVKLYKENPSKLWEHLQEYA